MGTPNIGISPQCRIFAIVIVRIYVCIYLRNITWKIYRGCLMKEPIFIDLDELIPGNPIDTIHGCNQDTADYPEEIDEHNKAVQEWLG